MTSHAPIHTMPFGRNHIPSVRHLSVYAQWKHTVLLQGCTTVLFEIVSLHSTVKKNSGQETAALHDEQT